MAPSRPLFTYFVIFYVIQLTDDFFVILRFETWISGVRSECFVNGATTTAPSIHKFVKLS